MTTAEFEKELTSKYGYVAYYDTGIVMFRKDVPVEEMEKDVRARAAALGYNGSWGVKGYLKSDKAHRFGTVTAPASLPKDDAVMTQSPSAAAADDDDDGQDGGVNASAPDGLMSGDAEAGADDGFEQMSFADFM